jgi:hypothetical protein
MPSVRLYAMGNRFFIYNLDTLTISSIGNIFLNQGRDINCYNYTLKAPFKCSPNIAIGTKDNIKLLAIYKISIAPIYFSLSNLIHHKTLQLYHLLLELIGHIQDGPKSHSLLLLKHQTKFKQDIIKLIQALYQLVIQEKLFLLLFLMLTATVI